MEADEDNEGGLYELYQTVLLCHYYVSDQLRKVTSNGTARESDGKPKLFAAL
jgi:hypothetical protein